MVIFWDASGSRGTANHKREIELLRACCDRWLSAAGGRTAVIRADLVLLRHAASKSKRFDVTRPNLAGLVAELEKVAYDGGTQLGAIGPLPRSEKPDFYLLFTDGISNFGREQPATMDAPAYIFSSDSGANHSLLHSLAMTAGGRYFNLARLKDVEVVAAVGQPAWSFLSASVESGQAEALYPELPQPVAGRFLLAGKLRGDTAAVTIRYGVKGQTPQQRTLRISRSDAAEGSLLRRLWAQKKLGDLMITQKRNQKEITTLGRQFDMVTPYTSLLVLDRLEQYVAYEITPPKSLPAMREEYHRQIDTLEHQKQKQKADKLLQVVSMWEQRVQWWNTQYKYPKDFKVQTEHPGYRDRLGGVGAGRESSRGAPAAGEPRSTVARPAEAAPHSVTSSPALPAPAAPAPAASRSFANGTVKYDDKSPGQDATSGSRQPGIVIKPWEPDTPYLKELRAAPGKNLFAVYVKNRAQYGASPAFFLDCADFFREHNNPELAIEVLSNIAELELEEATLLRVLGHRLVQIGQLDMAAQTFERVLELRPEEPQSYRDLALTLARRAQQAAKAGTGSPDAIRNDYSRAIDLLVHVIMDRWDVRFPEIEVIALEEVNRIIPPAKAVGVSKIGLDPRLVRLLDVDIRIVMTWHADNTDIDLWVIEPSGEKAYYGHNRTTIGGLVSRDFTQGYGPEEYLVRKAAMGMYRVETNFFGSRATRLLGAVTVQVDVFTNFGRPNEQCKSLTVRLKGAQETVRIGEIEF